MSIRFQCPACKAVRAANPRLLGRQINCPECGGPVQLPTREQAEQAKQQRQAAKQQELQQERALQRILSKQSPSVAATAALSDDSTVTTESIEAEEQALKAAETSFTRPKPQPRDDMDMTPMVDVTFLLLIFFMITASFSVQKSIQRPAERNEDPSTNAVQQEDQDNSDIVTVQVDEFNAYNVITASGDRIVSNKQDLIIELSDARSGGGSGLPTKLIVQAHEDCIHASVIAALDAGREAQFESFEVSTVERFD